MERERWQQVEALYHDALARPQPERAAWLAQACADDTALRREVEELLRCDGATWDFIEDKAVNVLARQLGPPSAQSVPVVLLAGQQLGAYQILALLGKGGMGEVYRARDTRLAREVAIKVLPADYAHDADRLRRFEQEARATSALNHPNILTIYEFGSHADTPYIVEELLEGENLRAQLERGSLAPKKAIEYARQIAAGLAAAHDKGIVHRDLKPENLFITKDGRVKILDFGLAKLKSAKLGNALGSTAPSQPLTNPGMVMGTISYMAPEQVRGEEADPRSDIFAFGIILYELLSGRQPFAGGSVAEVMSAILKEEPPDLAEVNARVSASLEQLVRHCLEKDPELRFQSARDLGFALEAFSSAGSASHSTVPGLTALFKRAGDAVVLHRHRRERLLWWGLVAVSLLAVGLAWAYFAALRAPRENHALRLALNPPVDASFDSFALSPDGRWLAFTGITGGKVQLWLRALETGETKVVPGTEGARFPFWSPDSQWLAFFGGSGLKKQAIAGGPAQTLCDLVNPVGGSWNRDDVIIFGKIAGGLLRVSAAGGKATQLMLPDLARQERQYYFPHFLPDGHHFLYTVLGTNREIEGIYLGSLDGQIKQRVLAEASAALYAPAGYLLFQRDESLLAQGFEADKLRIRGEAFTVAERVAHDPVYEQLPLVAVSGNGLLAYDAHHDRQVKQLLWLDRSGKQLSIIDGWWPNTRPAISPDGQQFVADKRNPTTNTFDLFVSDLTGDNYRKFTFDPGSPRYPLWSPDGKRIFWTSTRADGFRLFQKAASGEGQDEPVLNYRGITNDISRDGRYLIFEHGYPLNQEDVWIQPFAEGQAPYPFQVAEGNQSVARLSPDGRWLAYVSTETGTREIYVQRFPEGGSKQQVSANGGAGPDWRRDGKELFYYEPTGRLMAVPVVTGEKLELGTAMPLFDFRAGTFAPANASYAATADGQRFLISAIVDTEPRAPLTVIVNWTGKVEK